MINTTSSSRKINLAIGISRRTARKKGAVFITKRGSPTYVMLSFDEYQQLLKPRCDTAQVKFEPPPATIRDSSAECSGWPLMWSMPTDQAGVESRAKNQHEALDAMRHRIACEVLSRFPLNVIRERSRENLLRWRAQGVWSDTYEEWLRIVQSNDESALISCMIGFNDDSYRLRQSMPYAGMLDQSLVQTIHETLA